MCIAVVSAIGFACSKGPDVSAAIRGLIDDRQSDVILLVDATPFAWDQVYLFSPYTPRNTVCATLRLDAQECDRRIPHGSSDDGVMSIGFMAQGGLVHLVDHLRSNGDFTPVPPAQPLTAQTAVFRVVQKDTAHGMHGWVQLKLE